MNHSDIIVCSLMKIPIDLKRVEQVSVLVIINEFRLIYTKQWQVDFNIR